MKYLIPTSILLAVLLSACQSQEKTSEIPEKLEDKRALLKEKRNELNQLTQLVHRLEKAVAKQDPGMAAENRPVVTTVPVQRQNFKHFVEIQASVEADDYIGVTSEVAGRITKLTVEEGGSVRRGQLIAELDLEQLEKQMAELEKSLELANTVYERQKRLWDQDIGSEMQYLEAENNKERLEKSIETLDYQMSKAKIYAPASGIVETVFLQTGELASPGAPIIEILNPRKLKAVADVPENYLRAVNKGETVTVKFPALDQEQQARITLIGRTIDPANRTFKVEAALSDISSLIKPNLLAVMYIKDKQIDGAVTVPLEMVQQEVGGKDYVYVIGEGKGGPVARKVYVTTGESYNGDIVIKEGLKGGETLIMEGARSLAENEPVRVRQQG